MVSPFYFSFVKKHPNFSQVENLRLFLTDDVFSRILTRLKKHKPYSIPFLYPVKKKDAYNYYEIIKNPMDLQTMTKRVELYDEQSFRDDFNLIYNNCITYNVEGLICEYAREMKRFGEKLMEEEFERQMVMHEDRKMLVCNDGGMWMDVTEKVLVREKMEDINLYMSRWIAVLLRKRFPRVQQSALTVLSDVFLWWMNKMLKKHRKIKTKDHGHGIEYSIKMCSA